MWRIFNESRPSLLFELIEQWRAERREAPAC